MLHKRIPLLLIAAAVAMLAVVALVAPRAFAATPPVFTGLVEGVAVGGYDPVAYFTEGKPVKGSAEFTLEHGGVTWRFASAEHRATFEVDPAKYAPQYGGYCAYAVANGYTEKAEPDAWTIHDGKLYLNFDKSVQAIWEKDIPGYVEKADANWPGVLE
jgi:YHS domain-containing protein